jgi:hypothetical protein
MYEEDLLSRVHQDEAKLAYKWEHWAQWDAQRRKDDMQHTSLLEQRRRKGESHIRQRDMFRDRGAVNGATRKQGGKDVCPRIGGVAHGD